jgi:hypothetical protein
MMEASVRIWQTYLLQSEVVGARPTDLLVEPTPTELRFWSHVNWNGPINPRRPELGPCWVWTGSCYQDPRTGEPSYGQIMVNGKRMGAHRAAYILYVGPVPAGLDVMHACDTKRCVRLSHISAGTRSENLFDGFASPANQGVCAGENNGRARLTWDIVHSIRAGNERTIDLARRYGVSAQQITNIKHGRKWPESKCPTHSAEVAA